MATVSGYTDGDWGLRPISFHECTEVELKEFATPTHDSKLQLDDIISSETRSLFCLDWDSLDDELKMFGSWSSFNSQGITVLLAPCNFALPGHEDFYPIAEECIKDEQAQRDYLETFYMKLLMVEQYFEQDEFGADSIKTQSRFYKQ